MSRQLKLAAVVAVALSTCGALGSAEAHIGIRGGGGGGIRIGIGGGGLAPRARQGNGNRGNGGVVRGNTPAPAPAPKVVVPPPVAQKVVSKPPVATSTKPVTPATKAPTKPAPAAPAPTPETAPAPAQRGPSVFVAGPEVKPIDEPATAEVEAKANGTDFAAEAAPAGAERKPVPRKEPPLPQILVGATVTLDGKDLSTKAGQVVLQIGEIALPATIKEWKNDSVVCTLPALGLTKPSKATLHILKADGEIASTKDIELVTVLTPTDTPSPDDTARFAR